MYNIIGTQTKLLAAIIVPIPNSPPRIHVYIAYIPLPPIPMRNASAKLDSNPINQIPRKEIKPF